MECAPFFRPDSTVMGTRWRGIRFENARFKKELTQANTLYVKVQFILCLNLFPDYFLKRTNLGF